MQLGVGIHLWIKFFQGNDSYALADSLHSNHLSIESPILVTPEICRHSMNGYGIRKMIVPLGAQIFALHLKSFSIRQIFRLVFTEYAASFYIDNWRKALIICCNVDIQNDFLIFTVRLRSVRWVKAREIGNVNRICNHQLGRKVISSGMWKLWT